MTEEEQSKIRACFGALATGLAKQTGLKKGTMHKRLRSWLAGKASAAEVLKQELTPHKGRKGRIERQYGFNVEGKAKEIGISMVQLRDRLRQVEAGTKTIAAALAPHRRVLEADINYGLSAARLANLSAVSRVGTWERQYL